MSNLDTKDQADFQPNDFCPWPEHRNVTSANPIPVDVDGASAEWNVGGRGNALQASRCIRCWTCSTAPPDAAPLELQHASSPPTLQASCVYVCRQQRLAVWVAKVSARRGMCGRSVWDLSHPCWQARKQASIAHVTCQKSSSTTMQTKRQRILCRCAVEERRVPYVRR